MSGWLRWSLSMEGVINTGAKECEGICCLCGDLEEVGEARSITFRRPRG